MTTYRQWQDWREEDQFEMYQDLEKQVKGLKETAHNKNEAIIQLGERIKELEAAYSAVVSERTSIQDEFNRAMVEWHCMKGELTRTKNQALLASEEIGKMEAELADYKEGTEDLKMSVADLHGERDKLDTELAKSQHQAEFWKTQYDALEIQAEKWNDKLTRIHAMRENVALVEVEDGGEGK